MQEGEKWESSVINRCHQSGGKVLHLACVSPGGRNAYSILNNECQSHRFHQAHNSCAQWLVTHSDNSSCKEIEGSENPISAR